MTTWQPPRSTAVPALPRHDRRILHLVAAVAALLLVIGLVVRGTVGLSRPLDERIVTVDPTTGQVTSGGVDLTSDTTRAMFPDVHLEPGVPQSACIQLGHRGSVPLETVALRMADTKGSAQLLEQLRLRIERGEPGAGADCTGFTPVTEVAAGTVTELTGTPAVAGWSAWDPDDGEEASFRFTVGLDEDATDVLQGSRARVDFLWAATAQPVGEGLTSRITLVALEMARDAVLPMLLLMVIAVLFLGVQDRIDRRDPKLALAPVVEEPRTFRDPEDPAADGLSEPQPGPVGKAR